MVSSEQYQPTHEDFLRHLRSYQPDLEQWRVRAARQEEPQKGSELFMDDRVFVYDRISDAARLSLSLAGEHIRLAWTAIEAEELYPSAHFTVLRGALVAASQALYFLGPDDPQLRRARGLAVIAESYRNLKNFHRDFQGLEDLTRDEQLKLKNHLEWLELRIRQTKEAGADKNGFKLTDDVIPYAAKLIYGSDPGRRHGVLSLWRKMSGDAHALGWPIKLRASVAPARRGELLSEGTAGGSLADIAEPFEVSYRFLKRGWSLFDQRCEAG